MTTKTLKYYSIAGMRVAMDDGANLTYFASDHLSSTSISLDTSGTLLSEQRYKPFGELRTDVGTILTPTDTGFTDFGYTGQRDLGDIKLMDYNARFYSPALGRFIQPDSIVPNLGNSQSWNRYSYVGNNPVNRIDPSGHYEICDLDGTACPGGPGTGGGGNFQKKVFCERNPGDRICRRGGPQRAPSNVSEISLEFIEIVYGVEISETYSHSQAQALAKIIMNYALLIGGAASFRQNSNVDYIARVDDLSIWSTTRWFCGGACYNPDDDTIYLGNRLLEDPLGFTEKYLEEYKGLITNSSTAFAFAVSHEITHGYVDSLIGKMVFAEFQFVFLNYFIENTPAVERNINRGNWQEEAFADIVPGFIYDVPGFDIYHISLTVTFPDLNFSVGVPPYSP